MSHKKSGNSSDWAERNRQHHRDYVRLYHYTNSEGVQGIMRDGEIKQSWGKGDAAYGKGAYFTAKAPTQFSRTEIARNNYDDGGRLQSSMKNAGRVDYAVAVDVPRQVVEKVNSSDRNIYVARDNVDVVAGNAKVWSTK